jgi:hypothetical protein
MDPSSILKRLEVLEDALSALEERVTRLDRGLARMPSVAAASESPARVAAEEGIASGIFVRLAAAVFALLGALSLRVATQQGMLSARLGVGAGCLYCALLLAAPLFGRRIRWLRTCASLLQYCALSLAPLIILEMAPRMHLGTAELALALAAIGVAGTVAAVLGQAGRLAGYGLLVSLAAIASLGLGPEAQLLRALVVACLFGLASALAHWKNWGFLRPAVWPVGGLVLSILALAAVRCAADLSGGSRLVIVAAVLMWAIVVVSCTLRTRVLAAGEAVWLPLAGLWAYALTAFLAPALAPTAGLVVGAIALGIGVVQIRLKTTFFPLAAGLVAMGSLLLAAVLPALEPTGISVAALAVLCAAVAGWVRSHLFKVLSAVFVLEAVTCWLAGHFAPSGEIPGFTARVVPGLVFAAALWVHAVVVSDRPESESGQRLRGIPASLSLGASVVVLALSLRNLIVLCTDAGEMRQLGETVGLAAVAVGVAYAGRALGNVALRALGIVAVAMLSSAVLFRDFANLTGWRLLVSVITMGSAFLGISFTWRRRATMPKSSQGN